MDYLKYIGKKFKHGGRGPNEYDCFGLVRSISEELGTKLPNFTEENDKQKIHTMIYNYEPMFEKIEKPEPHCFVAISLIPGWTTHIGMMIDNNRFIHIMEKSCVTIERIDSVLWKKRIKGYYKWKNNTV